MNGAPKKRIVTALKSSILSFLLIWLIPASTLGQSSNSTDSESMASEADSRQSQSLRKFKKSYNPYNILIQQGSVRRIDTRLSSEQLGLKDASSQDDVAFAFLNNFDGIDDLLRVELPRQNLRLVNRAGDKYKTLTFRQYYEDIPVYGAWFQMTIEETKDGKYTLNNLSGNYTPDLTIEHLEPIVSSTKAEKEIAEGYLLLKDPQSMRLLVPTKLWIYDEALFAPKCPDLNECPRVDHNPRLAWRSIFYSPTDQGAVTDAFVDAMTGDVLMVHPRIQDTLDLSLIIKDANGSYSNRCWLDSGDDETWFDEDGVCCARTYCSCEFNECGVEFICAEPDVEGYDLSAITQDLYSFYQQVFRRNSYDGRGKRLEMYVHVGDPDDPGEQWMNAKRTDCGSYDIHLFGDEMVSTDVVGHEVAHSFHHSETDFEGSFESGAVGEHIADIFGIFFAHWDGRIYTSTDPDWLEGEDTISGRTSDCGTIRNLQDPTACGHPDHYEDYVRMPLRADHGGVHVNCNILSKAAYLLVQGGTHSHSGITVDGIGMEKARLIYYKTVTDKLTPNELFLDFRNHISDACTELIGRDGITPSDCCQVRNALAAVGIGFRDFDCDGLDDNADTDDDNDGVPDSDDNCPNLANASSLDSDSDGVGDACDDDDDGDNTPDEEDNCPTVRNNTQIDWDGNGIGDHCQDTDGDGVLDHGSLPPPPQDCTGGQTEFCNDNCPNIFNPDQADRDSDGIGDLCDSDIDADGVSNDSDNCIRRANSDQGDSDGDGVGNACDNCPSAPNSTQNDADNDGTGDLCDDDRDGDGLSNSEDPCPGIPHACPGPNFDKYLDTDIAFGEVRELTVIRRPFDPCQYIVCPEPGYLFGEDDYLHIAMNLKLGIPTDADMEQPININIGLVDESGYSLGTQKVSFFVGSTEQNASLSWQILPTYNWNSTNLLTKSASASTDVDIPSEADFLGANPSYYLVMSPEPQTDANRTILKQSSLEVAGYPWVGRPDSGECPLSQGFWKNHKKDWPVESLKLGGIDYSQEELLKLLKSPVKQDASLILAHQLISAKLNIANGSEFSMILTTLIESEVSLGEGVTEKGVKLPYGIKASNETGQTMIELAAILEDFNEGSFSPDCTLE